MRTVSKLTIKMIKNLPESGKDKILELINDSWDKGQLPTNWKKAIIIPVLKKGKPEDQPNSYRPISLTSCVCKLAERLILRRLTHILEERKIMKPEQAGFRANRCTEDQLIRIHHEVSQGFNNKPKGKRTLMTLVDFSKAFDTVWRKGLIRKLLDYDLPTCMNRWINDYITDRYAEVKMNGELSKRKAINEGVPQRGVLSPVLFNLFINDIGKYLPPDVHVSLFADDLAIWVQDQYPENCRRKMQIALNAIQKWTNKWRMHIPMRKRQNASCSLHGTKRQDMKVT